MFTRQWAVARCIVDYKLLFSKTWPETEQGALERHLAYKRCHKRCAERILQVLKANGGIYIKVCVF
jgi:aarF domain-containing kinase